MNDIVQRLRAVQNRGLVSEDFSLIIEAAEEIERLREYRTHHEFVMSQFNELLGGEIKTIGDLLKKILSLQATIGRLLQAPEKPGK